MKPEQALVGAGVVAVGLLLVGGATQISTEAGYGGVGPNFLPWVVGGLLLVCGAVLVWESATGGFRELGDVPGEAAGHWPGFAWVSVGLLLNAMLITTIGFILSCTLCFVLAVRGIKMSMGRRDLSLRSLVADALIGVAISAPVYWMFTKLLAINLPGLTSTGWL
jgi:putative tricarboxylic transport membrane protein